MGGRMRVDPAVRFSSKWIVNSAGCWVWQDFVNHRGYAKFYDGSRQVAAHRWSYEHHVGPIPAGLTIDHLCANPSCVNPEHLQPVTQSENTQRAVDRNHPPLVPDRHGTRLKYSKGCRCDVCRAGNVAYVRRSIGRRQARLVANPTLAPHGRYTTYNNWGCRCDECRGAHAGRRRAEQSGGAA